MKRIAIVVLIAFCGCSPEEKLPEDAVVVVSGAVNVRAGHASWNATEYDVAHANVPVLIGAIREQLEARAWVPLSEQWDSRGQKTSYVEGWTCHPSAEGGIIFQWLTDWRNERGDLVTYDISTPDDIRTVQRPKVRVGITYFPFGMVRARGVAAATGEPRYTIAADCVDLLAPDAILRHESVR
jgi:hypothetical protein